MDILLLASLSALLVNFALRFSGAKTFLICLTFIVKIVSLGTSTGGKTSSEKREPRCNFINNRYHAFSLVQGDPLQPALPDEILSQFLPEQPLVPSVDTCVESEASALLPEPVSSSQETVLEGHGNSPKPAPKRPSSAPSVTDFLREAIQAKMKSTHVTNISRMVIGLPFGKQIKPAKH